MNDDPRDYKKPALKLLLEALQANPSPPFSTQILVSEYTAHIALAAKECVPELKSMFHDQNSQVDKSNNSDI